MDYLLKALSYVHQCALPARGDVRIVCLSDTHSQQVVVPGGDILIHGGDLSKTGTATDVQETVSWLDAQPHEHKIVIAGNADLALETDAKAIQWGGVTYLQGSSTSVKVRDRTLRVYGDPHVPRCGPDGEEAFQYDLGTDYWNDLVPGTDILVTHTPPKFILDVWNGVPEGCESLLREVSRVQPLLHVFGHVHPAHGKEVVHWEMGGNASVLREIWWKESPNVWVRFMHVVIVLWLSLVHIPQMLWSGRGKWTIFVNAACAAPDGSHMAHEPQVIEI